MAIRKPNCGTGHRFSKARNQPSPRLCVDCGIAEDMVPLQKQVFEYLNRYFPHAEEVRINRREVRMYIFDLTDKDLDSLTSIEGKYKTLLIKGWRGRLANGLLLTFNF